jgi:acetolactate synthase I/II/III large subunit
VAKRRIAVESTADAYIALLAARGIDYLFGNGGTDFAPIVDVYARRLAADEPCPTPVTVPHEIPAVAMAHGYTMVSGRPQAVMVHTVAGTANAVSNLINAARAQVPMLLTAGRTPLTEGPLRGSRDMMIHWAQESFDQAAMVREWVKWDYELRFGADLEGVVDRALAIAQAGPQGPVYLTLPREVLAEQLSSFEYDERPRMRAGLMQPDSAAIEAAAQALSRAHNPVALTRAGGKDPAAVAPLVRLAERLNLPVFSAGTHMNFPATHALHQGEDPGELIEQADALLLIENDVPWTPKQVTLRSDAIVISAGADPLFARYPVRGFPVDISLGGDLRLTLDALADAVSPADESAVAERGQQLADSHKRLRAAARARAEAGSAATPVDRAWLGRCVQQLCTDETILINELGFDTTQLEPSLPGSYFSLSSAGVLGWGLGAALGAKLAAPEKTVVACVGDGSYMFGVPTAAHWVARRYKLPVLFIVWNNARWDQVAIATRKVFPEGWAVSRDSYAFSDLAPSLDYELICQAAGGYGERVESSADLPDALQRALHAVQVEGRQALLNVIARC